MDDDRLMELIGRVLATLEALNKNDDELNDRIDDLKDSVRSNFSEVFTRLNKLEIQAKGYEQKLKSMWWLISLIFGGFVSFVIYISFVV